MRLKYLVASASLFLGTLTMLGVPARPGFHTLTGPDGLPVEVEMRGDEIFHYFVDRQGQRMVRAETGGLRIMDQSEFDVRLASAARVRRAPAEINRTFPTTGTVRGLVILCEFPERKFQESSTREYFDSKINRLGYEGDETFGSVADFFAEQSMGLFMPVFDVVGPVTMPHPASYYVNGQMDLSNFFRDLCTLADSECDVDFSRYDIDEDGFVDFVFGIFAGYSQAQSLNADDIWPAMQYLENYVFDIFDDKYLNVAACASELRDADGVEKDGIGTICHEFSHILGLPDIYDTRNGDGYGMGHFDIMDVGTYNGGGKIPSGYTAMDRYTLGWLDPIELSGTGTDFELPSLVETNKAVFIVNPQNNAEYYTLENRQPDGFDSGLPGHGMVVSHVCYDPKVWKNNTVNAPMMSGYEHVQLVPADNNRLTTSEGGDPFPGTKKVVEFSATTVPTATWRTTDNIFDMPLTNIRELEDGTILFDYGATSGITDIAAPGMTVEQMITAGATFYNLAGIAVAPDNLARGIYIVRYKDTVRKFVVK